MTTLITSGPSGFSPLPSLDAAVTVEVTTSPPADIPLGVSVGIEGDPPAALGASRAQLGAVGFTGTAGATAVFSAESGAVTVAVGLEGPTTAAKLRDAAAHVANAVDKRDVVAVLLPADGE